MTRICPTVTAYDMDEYSSQVRLVAEMSNQVHIDLVDGDFAPVITPPLDKIWWPHGVETDIHLMYRRPMEHLAALHRLRPRMVIVHAEAEVHHMHFAAELHIHDIDVGLALLQHTPVTDIEQILHSFDHVLIFSGNLGHHGGHADIKLLDKVREIRRLHPEVTIGWDGGIDSGNAIQLTEAGVDVLNVGGYIHKSKDPKDAYATLKALIENRYGHE